MKKIARPFRFRSAKGITLKALDQALLDATRESQCGGSPEQMTVLIGAFLNQTPSYLKRMEVALRNQDLVTFAQEAQRLSLRSSAMGATLMARLCEQISQNAKEGKKNLRPALAHLAEEFTLIRESLEQEQDKERIRKRIQAA